MRASWAETSGRLGPGSVWGGSWPQGARAPCCWQGQSQRDRGLPETWGSTWPWLSGSPAPPTNTSTPSRAHDEQQMFSESGGLGGGAPFCLAAAPVLFHLQVRGRRRKEYVRNSHSRPPSQTDPELLEYIRGFQGDLSKLSYRKVYDR